LDMTNQKYIETLERPTPEHFDKYRNMKNYNDTDRTIEQQNIDKKTLAYIKGQYTKKYNEVAKKYYNDKGIKTPKEFEESGGFEEATLAAATLIANKLGLKYTRKKHG